MIIKLFPINIIHKLHSLVVHPRLRSITQNEPSSDLLPHQLVSGSPTRGKTREANGSDSLIPLEEIESGSCLWLSGKRDPGCGEHTCARNPDGDPLRRGSSIFGRQILTLKGSAALLRCNTAITRTNSDGDQ
jgi:hypothetical protein